MDVNIFAIIDQFSRYINLNAAASQDEKTVRKMLLNRWILKFGPPKEIHVDRGKTFESALFKDMAKNLKLRYSIRVHIIITQMESWKDSFARSEML